MFSWSKAFSVVVGGLIIAIVVWALTVYAFSVQRPTMPCVRAKYDVGTPHPKCVIVVPG